MMIMLKKPQVSNKLRFLIYGLTAVFYFWMAAQIPYTHDDWDWGLDVGLQQLIHATVNSRYAGNFFEVIMTRSGLLKTIIMGFGFWYIPLALSRIASRLCSKQSTSSETVLFLICNCLLLTMNREMWRQTYGWVAGYANFGISALFMLLWINELIRCCDPVDGIKKDSSPLLVLIFLASTISQLFLENLAIYHLAAALFICCIHFYRTKRIPMRNLTMFFGAAFGLIVMFSSSLYDTLFSTGAAVGNYRQIPLLGGGGLMNALRQIAISAIHLSNRLYSGNFILCVFVLAVLAVLVHKASLKQGVKRAFLFGNLLLTVLLFMGFIYDHMAEIHQTIMFLFDVALSLGYFLMVLIETWVLFQHKKALKWQLIFLWLSPVIIIAPLVVTTEYGARLFFTTNIYVILFDLILMKQAWDGNNGVWPKVLVPTIAFVASFLFIFHGFIYVQIGECKNTRDTIIETALLDGASEISLPAYPFREYLQFPDPIDDWRIDYFKEFYGIPLDVNVTFEN